VLNKVTFNSPTLTGIHQVAVDPVAVGVRVVIRVVDGPIFEVAVGAVSLHALEPAVIQHTGQGERRYSEVVHVGMEVQVLDSSFLYTLLECKRSECCVREKRALSSLLIVLVFSAEFSSRSDSCLFWLLSC